MKTKETKETKETKTKETKDHPQTERVYLGLLPTRAQRRAHSGAARSVRVCGMRQLSTQEVWERAQIRCPVTPVVDTPSGRALLCGDGVMPQPP